MTFIKGHKINLGKKHFISQETKNKISQTLKGNVPWNKGKKHSKKSIEKMRKSQKKSEEIKKKISNGLKGRRLSEECKRKIGLAHKGRKLPEEQKRKMSLAQKGEKGSGWKGGITPINKIIRMSLECRLWREAIFKRDNWTCIWCRAKSGKGIKVILNADHIKPFAYYPELRFAIDNGRTLCIDCHKKTENYAGKGFKRLKTIIKI